jgi:integrase
MSIPAFTPPSQSCFPEHLAEFVVSVHTGMRISEQYTLDWSQVHLDRKAIELSRTKNGDARTVHLNADAIAAIESLKAPGQKMKGRLFPPPGWRQVVQQPFLVRAMPRGSEDYRVHLAWQPSHLCSWLAMAGASTKEIQDAARP